MLRSDNQLDAAKEAVSQAIGLVPPKGQEFLACQSQRLLSDIYRSKGERENAIHHFEAALAIVSPFNWHDQLFWINYDLALLFLDEREFEVAHTHVRQAKSHTLNDAYKLGRAMGLQARIWHQERRLKEAKSEALRAIETYEKLGAANDLKGCRTLLQEVEREMEIRSTPDSLDPNGELL